MDFGYKKNSVEIWAGAECTINRVKDQYLDQLELAGNYKRKTDFNELTTLGISAVRFPVLWEKFQPLKHTPPDFKELQHELLKLTEHNIIPIAGLMHHGSGPSYTDLLDENFPYLLSQYASQVAYNNPSLQYYIPVNEPLTTARFSGLYGHWYPHLSDEYSFYKMLLNQLKGVVLSMKEIKKINPDAKLIQTEDLAKIYSTPFMKYQADYENIRRWLTFDLLTGLVDSKHPLWFYILNCGIPLSDLHFFLDNICVPDIIGANYYVTSERYLDEKIYKYPSDKHGKNKVNVYADVEAVRVNISEKTGLKSRLKEIWFKYKLPVALTEIHMNCHREEQMRWFYDAWKDCIDLKTEGVDIRAITAWALLGSYGWNELLTGKHLKYETGIYDISSGKLRETAMVTMIKDLHNNIASHPILKRSGWWKKNNRFYNAEPDIQELPNTSELIFIISKRGSLGKAFARHCDERSINYLSFSRNNFDICNIEQMTSMIRMYKPWAIINCAGYVNVDQAECEIKNCFDINTKGVIDLSVLCNEHKIKLLTFSTDLVFNGDKQKEYSEDDKPDPLNIYGISKFLAEHFVMQNNPDTLVVRTSSFFSPYDEYNFLSLIYNEISEGRFYKVANDVIISPTYLPHLVNKCLDLLIDNEKGIFHLTNEGALTWSEFAFQFTTQAGLNTEYLKEISIEQMNYSARRPQYSALTSIKGRFLPSLDEAIRDFIKNYKRVRSNSDQHILVK
ncbi:MAG: family 1 glycosylhydrolase [Ignavibacteria bacterium]